jgi:hypothetical protein
MRMKKSYWIIAAVLAIAFVVGLLNEGKMKKEEVKLFNEKNVYETNLIENWNTFKKEHEFSENARIEEFSMTLNHLGTFESVKLKLIDTADKDFTIFNYQDCRTCPEMQDEEISVWQETAKKANDFSTLQKADEFFAKLQEINSQKVFTKDKGNTLFLIRTRQWSDNILLPGEYLKLENGQLTSAEPATEQAPLKGYNLQILENSGINFNSDENTVNIIMGE